MKKENQLELYEKVPIPKALVTLMIPATVASLINLIYNMINSIFIGMLHNQAMLASITVSGSVVMAYGAFASAIGVGASSYISRQLGAKQYEDSRATAKTAITLAFLVYLLQIVLVFTVMDPLLNYLSTDSEVFSYAHSYCSILLIGSISAILKQVIINLLRADGDVMFPMYLFLFSAVMNIVLDPFLMFEWGLNLGVSGAALATVISQFMALFLMLYRICVKANYVKWKLFDFGIDLLAVKEIVKVGSAVFVRDFLPNLSNTVFAKSAGIYGTLFVAGAGVGKKASRFAISIVQGATKGYLPFAAYNYGARKLNRLKKSVILLTKYLTIFTVLMSGVFLVFPKLILRLYSSDATVINYGAGLLSFSTISLIAMGIYNVMLILLQALGRSRDSMLVSLARGVFYYIPIVYFLPKIIGITGVYLAQPLTDWLTVLTVLLISRATVKEIFAPTKESSGIDSVNSAVSETAEEL